ncbi:nucleoside 2-deoxyribosyltransferase [Leptospira ognonensis]|uniref:Nucleoside 2-deoxyribosyltransferase n=1 Tax=Leptospira ognonensis TaxID=2484945 RepID=A0A4R9KCS5_9LEPT|nr:nucleoside 2-deoxyribosyltransferase [Leptospira ognonensis]TGL63906.1 nucleoside 2-deoxyribosyltransferase [Leptospira ognonensis]
MREKIYLAGPEVFLPETHAYFRDAKLLCNSFGFEGISPFDGEPNQALGIKKADFIFQNNCNLIDSCGLVIANCNPFRGALIDDGTAFEIGYAFANKKRIYGFLKNRIPLLESVKKTIETREHTSGFRIDGQGYLVNENFGNSINLMMEMAILNSGGKLIEGSLSDVLSILP